MSTDDKKKAGAGAAGAAPEGRNRLIPIREFAEVTGIPASTLRYYDDSGLFRPVHRDTSGYRYYEPMQIVTVKFIRVLIDCGLSLKAIKKLAEDRSPEEMIRMLHTQALKLDREIIRMGEDRAVLSTFLDLMTAGLMAREDEITIEEMPKMRIALGAGNRFNEEDLLFYKTFVRFLRETPGINPSYPVGGYFGSLREWAHNPSEPDRFFSVDPRGPDEKPEGYYLVGYTRGYYGETGDLPERMLNYADRHGIVTQGPLYNIYLHDEVSVKDARSYLMQASVLVL